MRLAYGGLLVVALLVAVGAGLVHYGGPQHVASRAYDSFKARPISVSNSGNLNKRLFSLSGSGRLTQWRVAVDDYRAHPWLGSGAGTYELSWLHDRPTGSWKIRDAHNLYVEVLAELGPVGLALLLLTLSIPIYAAVKVRRHPLVPIALGAYVAFLLHAAVDWDWEMPALTIAGLLCGVAIMVVARSNPEGRPLTKRVRIGAVTAIAVSCGLRIRRTDGQPRDRRKQQRGERFELELVREPRAVTRSGGCPGHRSHGGFRARRSTSRGTSTLRARTSARRSTRIRTTGSSGRISPRSARTEPGARRRGGLSQLNPLAPELAEFRKALGGKG